ncbi:hypothetical protein N7519_011319 [Penicillium mononematosum]|uniref:uncharacterized protein n=1 Tax=Penicillium mononematosum TaxID=268346 RepID=UPI0025499295|nr:uncharacterized protein N7519_011319 [Penicillium mononematosum]KAJ6180858.1 hypothetical protein N7519_011319 [Penicillium mononematosum]
MLPKSLQSSYTRYKDDTNSFATWLLNAADKCGYQPPGLTSTANPSDSLQYKITVKDLQLLADVVAESALTVPKPVIIIVKRAIKLRKHVTSWFLGQGDSEDNKRHAHFISALEKVCETLESKMNNPFNRDNEQSPIPEAGGGDTNLDMFVNKFSVLAVEEPQEPQQGQRKSPELKNVVKAELVDNDEDEATDSQCRVILFKAYCLFQDLYKMRAFISHTWSEYRDKKIDLMNAAVVTDSALQLARDLVQEVIDDWSASAPSYVDGLQKLVFNLACHNSGIDVTPSSETGLPYGKEISDVAYWYYLPTRTILESFIGVLQDNHIPVFKKGCSGTYDPKANREGMSVGQKFNEDYLILLQLLPEFFLIHMSGIHMLARDAITAGLVELFKTKKVTPWLCFASQVLLDVHHIMRYSTLGAFGDLRVSGLRIQKTIDEYLQVSKPHPPLRFWPKEGDEEIKAIHLAVVSWIIRDPLSELRRKGISKPGDIEPEKHVLFSQHAILCGLVLFHVNTRMQSIGQQLVSQWYDVLQLAFLYNLAKTESHKDLSWPDMEAFVKIHGESHIFIGSRPKNVTESLNRLELATGISSVARFARNSRNREYLHRSDKKKPRVLTPTTTVANLFRDQYVAGVDGIRNIGTVLDILSQEPSLKVTSKELQSSNPDIMFQQKWSHTRNFGTLQLLMLLKRKLFEEEPLLLFNYFGMHKRSLELLSLIKAKEHRNFDQFVPTSCMPDEYHTGIIGLLVHHIARGSAQDARAMGLSVKTGTQIHSQIVKNCGDIMQEYLQKNGDVACKELRVFCKNKKPIQDEIDSDKGMSDEFRYWFDIEEVLEPKVLASLMTGIPIA